MSPTPVADRVDRFVDIVAAALVTVFTFGLPLPEMGLSPRAMMLLLSGWALFLLDVGVLWYLHRDLSRRRTGDATPAEVFLHLPFVAALLMLTVPARRLSVLLDYPAGPGRRAEFLGSLAWFGALLGIGFALLVAMRAAGRPAPDAETLAARAFEASRTRLLLGAAVLGIATAFLLPHLGGKILLAWFVLPPWVTLERRRLLRDFPGLRSRLD